MRFSAHSGPFGPVGNDAEAKDMGGDQLLEPTGEMTCAVKGSASCKNRTIDSWRHGRGVFLTTSDPPSVLLLPSALGVRLLWFEGPATEEGSGSGSATLPIAETC